MSYGSDSLADLFIAGSPGRPGMPTAAGQQHGQGVVLAWDQQTGRNRIRYRGMELEDVPIQASTEILVTRPGDVVSIASSAPNGGAGVHWITGRLVVPGTPEAARSVEFLRGDLVANIVDEFVMQLLTSPAGRTLIDGIVADLLVSPAGRTLIDGIVADLLVSPAGLVLSKFVFSQHIYSASLSASGSRSSSTFGNLSSGGTGPTVTGVPITSSGRALVFVTATVTAAAPVQGGGNMSFTVSGATTQAADQSQRAMTSVLSDSNGGTTLESRMSAAVLVTGLNSGTHTFTAVYRDPTGTSPAASWADRNLTVIAL